MGKRGREGSGKEGGRREEGSSGEEGGSVVEVGFVSTNSKNNKKPI